MQVLRTEIFTKEPWTNKGNRNSARDGILGHQFNKRAEPFAQCYSLSLLLADSKEKYTLFWFKKSLQKIRETRKLQSTVFMNSIL
jgi:hypothetical protein